MAGNVFGAAVGGETRLIRAHTAREYPNAGGKRDMAHAYVMQQKQNFGLGVSTQSIFYNATGETLFYVEDRDSFGKIYDSYPAIVSNGQWGAFLHIKKPGGAAGSEAFVVYRGRYNDADSCKQLIAWDVPWSPFSSNHVYCQIYDDNFDINAGEVFQNMKNGGRQCANTVNGMVIVSHVGEGSSPLFEAQFTLANDVHGISGFPSKYPFLFSNI